MRRYRPPPPPPPRSPPTWDYNPHHHTCLSLPTTPTSTLPITSWTPLDPGGHSFVFRVTIEGCERGVVFKLFRFPTLDPRPGDPEHRTPYAYFRREAGCYMKFSSLSSLSPSPTSTTASTDTIETTDTTNTTTSPPYRPVPRLYSFISLSPAHETHLTQSQHLRGLNAPKHRRYYRKTPAEMPVVGVWMEDLSPCERLSKRMLQEEARLQEEGGLREGNGLRKEVMEAWRWVSGRGVLQGDVKWRNVIVRKAEGEEEIGGIGETGGKRAVWIDFSNARTREMVVEEGEDWGEEVRREEEKVRKMLRVGVRGGAGLGAVEVEGAGEGVREKVE
ncbi:hypothetical protein EX30DRAFT_396610 [Ascodesmis nigricans]|uniref:Protein kinase domain-containing protein n=1 Tax=Ascodesmis nigricans TaxID=341454 RepID=A0A4S2MU54_9PEZI|nr:hypothetical protein EX30DRAFT_396610 [Ascodesmis nigricans]